MSQSLLDQPEVRKAYDEYNKQERARLFKIVFWFAFFGMPAGISLDQQVYPTYVPLFLKFRLFSSLLVTILLVIYYRPWAAKFDRALFILLLMVPQGIITWMIYASEGPLSPYYAGLNLVLVAFCMLLPWTYLETLTFSVITMIFYLVACVAHGGVSFSGVFFNNFYFMLMTSTFAVMGSFFTNRLRVREFVTRWELDQNRKKLAESNQKLIELDQVKSRFFANISHELRTPLTLLIAPLETLQAKSELFDEATKETLKTMQGNAMRLLKLINDLLDLVKLESGRMEVKKEPIKLEEFSKGMVQALQATARDKRVHMSVTVAKDLGVVMADGDKLEKIILNLLFNSVKFTSGGGTVELAVKAEGKELVLQVKDSGMGISDENLPHVFDRFWQADSSAQRKYQGTGLGLSLVKELAEAQGGSVLAESQMGKGTTMTVRVPFEKVDASVLKTPKIASSSAESASGQDEWLAKLYRRAELFPTMTSLSETVIKDHYGKSSRPKLLVADDEPDMLRFLKSQLEKHYEIVEAVDGNQAVEKAKQFLPDLILLDMMMPEKDGIAACRELKSTFSTQSIPVILLTARADDETKMSALNAGASDFLTKPFSTTELHVRVKNLVESHESQRELARQKNALESTLEQLKETEGQLIQNEKMASLGRLSAGIIHEINNPLNYATSALHLLKMRKDRLPESERDKYVEIVSDIEEGVDRVQKIISDLRTFSHPHLSGKDWVNLADTLSTSLRFLSHELKEKVEVEIKVPGEQKVLVDRNRLIQVFVNLIQNSVDALREKKFEGGEKSHISITSEGNDGRVRIKLRDNGAGIGPENMDKIFDPFFTTKDVGQGMGLGLSVCYKILHEQGGSISVKSEKGKYTEFVLELPSKA